MVVAQGILLALSYLGLGLGGVPGLRMNRATLAWVSAAFLIGLGTLTLQEAWQAIDPHTLVFLLSMMVINAHLFYAGFFNLVLHRLLQLPLSPLGLLGILTVGTGALSAVFLNDTLALVTTPLVLRLTCVLKLNPVPYLLAMAGATNLGSVATLSGNPQNILVGSLSGIGYVAFSQALLPIAVVGLAVQMGWLWVLYPQVRSLDPISLPPLPRLRLYRPLLAKTLVISGLLLLAFVVGLPLAESALMAAALLLVTRRLKPERILGAVDGSLLILFSGLFILTRSVQELQVLDPFQPWLSHPAGLLVITATLSNLISNVPTVLLLQTHLGVSDTQSWLLLAAGSTLAGNLTLLGSVANLITVEAAAAEGYRLSFWEHLRFGIPLTLVMLGVTFFWVVKIFSF